MTLNLDHYPVLRVLPQNRHLLHTAELEGTQLSFSLQRAQEESKEFQIQLVNREYDYAHLISILETHEVIQFISLVSSPLTDLLQIQPGEWTRLKPLQTRNPHKIRREINRGDLSIQFINIQNGIIAHNDYEIPELPITNPDVLFVAEAGAGNLIEQPQDLTQRSKLGRWGLQAYTRNDAEVLLEHDEPELQMITINYQGFTLSALYIPPATTCESLSRALNQTQVIAMLEASDQVMGDFNMHVKGYLTPRDDARARIVNPIM